MTIKGFTKTELVKMEMLAEIIKEENYGQRFDPVREQAKKHKLSLMGILAIYRDFENNGILTSGISTTGYFLTDDAQPKASQYLKVFFKKACDALMQIGLKLEYDTETIINEFKKNIGG